LKRLAILLLLLIVPLSVLALVAEERPGISYLNQVLFLHKKIVENGEVAWVTLAYADPATGKTCQNFIDVLGGRQLFAGIPEKSWLLVDFQLRSLVVESGFAGDADVTSVTPCGGYQACSAERDRRGARTAERETAPEPGAGKGAESAAPLVDVGDRLLAGRQLVKAARCRSCHKIEGFGADHAPSLTWRRHKYQPGWLVGYLAAPYRMRPGMTDLMMLDYTSPNAVPHLQPEEIVVLADYLQQLAWLKSPAGRFRLEPWTSYNCFGCHSRIYRQNPLQYQPTSIPQPLQGEIAAEPVMRSCMGCHLFGNAGPAVQAARAFPLAPDLLLAIEKLRTDYIIAYLRDPNYVQPGSSMPKLALTEEQLADLEGLVQKVRDAIAEGKIKPVHRYYRMEKRKGQVHPQER
jgi:hypothetical protein